MPEVKPAAPHAGMRRHGRREAGPIRVEVDRRTTVHSGFCRVDKLLVRHELYAGGMSGTLDRELVARGEVASVLPLDPVREEVVLIEQFRPGPHVAGWPDPWLVEIVAGLMEPGESGEELARREAIEEAGCVVTDLLQIAHYLPSPGASSESMRVYCGRTDSSEAGGLHGLDHEGEDIRAFAVPVSEAIAMVRDGHIVNAVTLIALQWLTINYADLKARWT